MRKRLLSVLLCGVMVFCGITSCGVSEKEDKNNSASESENSVDESNEKDSDEKTSINIACMKGPTAIGMIELFELSERGESYNDYNYSIVGKADEISTGLVKGDLDIAAVPCNLASILYNKTDGEIVTVAINTLGVLYIVEQGESIQSVADLKGKTIYSTGQGTTPEYTLRYLLSSAGINPDEEVTIEYKSEASEVVAVLNNDASAVAMLPQPYVTVAMNNNQNIRIALDVTNEWENMNDGTVVTGVIVANKKFIEENETAFKEFMKEYKESTEFANEYIDETAEYLEKYDVFKAEIAKKAIPYCNVTYIDGEEMQKKIKEYLN